MHKCCARGSHNHPGCHEPLACACTDAVPEGPVTVQAVAVAALTSCMELGSGLVEILGSTVGPASAASHLAAAAAAAAPAVPAKRPRGKKEHSHGCAVSPAAASPVE